MCKSQSDWVKFESCMTEVQRISYFLLLNQLPYTPQDQSYKDAAHTGPNICQMFAYADSCKMPTTYQESSF